MKKILLTLLLFSFGKGIGISQAVDSLQLRLIAAEILNHGKAYENLRYLTKQIGPRLAGSAGMVKSEQWGLKLMRESGADTAWMQPCIVPHWDRGGKDLATAKFQSQGKVSSKSLDIVALGNSMGSGSKGVDAEVILIRDFAELEQRKDEIKGKIVFYNYVFDNTYINTFQAYRDAGQYRGQGPSRAAKYGAVAVIVRSLSHAVDNNPHTGSTRYDSNYAKIPAVAIGLRDADWLSYQLQLGLKTGAGPVKVKLVTNGRFLPDKTGHNIIGEIRGSTYPDEIITVGGHLDSWDNCEGAHDDGAGCVQTIEILRAFKAIGLRPQRTIRFVLFANEENGLRGGNKYAEEAKLKKEKHIIAIESDAGGFTPRGMGLSGSEEQFQKFMGWKQHFAMFGATDLVKGGGGADIGPLNRALGTPTASLNPDSQRYFDIHHSRSDTFETVNKRELELGAVNMAALIYLVAKYGL
jgi:hypothetical protein